MRNYRYWAIILVLGFSGLVLTGAAFRSDTFFQIKKNFTIFSEVFQEVTARYVDEVDPEVLIRHGINAMLETLDPYTVLMDESQGQNMEILTRGSYAGVGIEVGARGGRLVVVAPMEGYSAWNKGMRAGDIILRVDGLSVDGFSVDDLQSLIMGEPGTTLVLTVERFGFDQPLDFELTRQKVEVKNITYSGFLRHSDGIGYVSLARFGQNAAGELQKAITDLKEEGELRAIVLDLRNNPGGLLDEAVRVTDLFVPQGREVVKTRGRGFESSFTARTENPVFYDGPLIILQNNGSASSSEIVAGALQDFDRAVIIGQRSFGKGLVQIIRNLSYNVSLKITTSRYYIPSGRSIQSALYTPDDPDASEQLPDSLRNQFRTLGGRIVYDGVGIDPDILVPVRSQSLLEVALLRQSSYFFFASEYASGNDTYLPESDAEPAFLSFADYLLRSDFVYETRAQRYFAGISTQLESVDDASLVGALSTLDQFLSRQKMKDMEEQRSVIMHQLNLELISRFDGPNGRLLASLQSDPVIDAAVDLLNDRERFDAILRVAYD
jgi:carboxyl-terminal processing protease